MNPLLKFAGGKNNYFVLASGPAFHYNAICLVITSGLCIATGSVLINFHLDNQGCKILDDEETNWLLKLGASAVGLGIFFLISVIVVWVLNRDFVKSFGSMKMSISAISHTD